jgi:hypothetical protein
MRFWRNRQRLDWIETKRKQFDWLGTDLRFATLDTGLGEGEGVLPGGLTLSVRGTLDTNGRPLCTAFTSEQQLLAWFPEGSHWVEVDGRTALEMFLRGDDERIVVDPASDFPPVLTREEVEELLGHT